LPTDCTEDTDQSFEASGAIVSGTRFLIRVIGVIRG
jgi:hypothetical protein